MIKASPDAGPHSLSKWNEDEEFGNETKYFVLAWSDINGFGRWILISPVSKQMIINEKIFFRLFRVLRNKGRRSESALAACSDNWRNEKNEKRIHDEWITRSLIKSTSRTAIGRRWRYTKQISWWLHKEPSSIVHDASLRGEKANEKNNSKSESMIHNEKHTHI